ncbi:MAG TPA: hypothetical protein VKY92_22360 [Verrucomicrobiae bacterium]|nr:hypothetical protein [Verrucomicrobiae bacterium]
MNRYGYLDTDSSLRETLDRQNVDELKRLLALLPGVKMKAPRKAEVIETLERFLLGDAVGQLCTQLPTLDQSALAEALHADEGSSDAGAFQAKYGALPVFERQGEYHWQKEPTLLRLFLHRNLSGAYSVPKDLREKLRRLVAKPAATKLSTLEEIPVRPVRQWTSSHFDEKKRERIYEQHDAPLLVRLTEQAAFQDLRTVLRLVDQEKISVSSKTFLASKATMALLNEFLREHDFFEYTEKVNSWDPEIGPVKAFSWPLLVQAAKLAALRHEKLVLNRPCRPGGTSRANPARDLASLGCARDYRRV